MWAIRADGWHDVAPWTVAPSPIHGRGVFCTRPIPQGSAVGVAHYYANGWRATPDLGRHHNHSIQPTCRNVTEGWYRYLVALRPLAVGEEITTDYRLQPDLEQPGPGWR